MRSTIRLALGALGAAAALALGCGGDPPTEPEPRPEAASILWHVNRAGVGTPALDGGAVYYADREQHLLAVGRTSGSMNWRVPVASEYSLGVFPPYVAIADGHVLAGNGALHAFDPATGDERWWVGGMADVFPSAPQSPAFMSDERRVYASGFGGQAIAVDLPTGTPAWHADLANDPDDPLAGIGNTVQIVGAHAGSVYAVVSRFTSGAGEVHALDAATGAVRWSYVLPPDADRFNALHDAVLVRASVPAPVLVSSFLDGRVVALSAADGGVRWSLPRRAGLPVPGDLRALTASGGLVAMTSIAGDVTAYDATSGAERWRVAFGDRPGLFAITSDARSVFVLVGDGVLGALDLQTGGSQWLRSLPGRTGGFRSAPALSDDALYIVGEQGLYAIRR